MLFWILRFITHWDSIDIFPQTPRTSHADYLTPSKDSILWWNHLCNMVLMEGHTVFSITCLLNFSITFSGVMTVVNRPVPDLLGSFLAMGLAGWKECKLWILVNTAKLSSANCITAFPPAVQKNAPWPAAPALSFHFCRFCSWRIISSRVNSLSTGKLFLEQTILQWAVK